MLSPEKIFWKTWTKFDKQAKTEYIPGEKGDYVLVPGWELPMSWVENGPLIKVGFTSITTVEEMMATKRNGTLN